MRVQMITASTRRHILSEKYLSDEMMTKSKSDTPLGVKVLAGGAGVIGGLMVVMSMGVMWSAFSLELLRGFEILGGLIIVVGLFYIVYAVGLWNTENWGWWMGMIMSGISILASFTAPFMIVYSLAVMVYLYSVREFFEITF